AHPTATRNTTTRMNATPDPSRYDDARDALRDVLGDLDKCTPREKDALRKELEQLTRVAEKLDTGRVDIVVFGEIDTGKSALINALVGEQVTQVSVRGGWTRELWNVDWDATGIVIPGMGDARVVLIDTPGINE